MPPKAKITKEMVLEAAFQLAREEGMERVSVRAIAKRLGCSTQPVLYCFGSAEELRQAVFDRADRFHQQCLFADQAGDPMLAIGAAYVRFAAQEKQLFRLLFQSNSLEKASFADVLNHPDVQPIIDILARAKGLDREAARDRFALRFMAVHGMASLLANNSMVYDEETVLRLLGQMG